MVEFVIVLAFFDAAETSIPELGHVSVGVTVGIAALAILASALTNFWIGSLSAARFRGSVESTLKERAKAVDDRFEALDEDLVRMGQVDRDQWKAIGENERQIGGVRDRVSGIEGHLKARGRGASS